ncbi:hypothetical protein METBIDRAFT_46962 [Metschnikowia bicuspidata var. bicuspidata NRRL YB-4993]|uniref:Uncharacterized protein n=1 Tax=Metschnikowia bicuspidata var. bicuspidata NRRL YB-4993 TaxID=869754 RepID=A0A1A0H5P1_9ASCO|nr:hypothetical protein METBIDRAFT_46962 [Metschnikowia bicuspidata var. bicuspidata NRRL YB-4993]OBA19351.1 hypothetical protein METBIDRAFT_46962 [Metschnikowia bicuspidata var. bicuspidata NRRL YB-4993]
MTVTILDPAKLSLFYPKASDVTPQKIRVISQAVDYDISSALLAVQRLPNLGPLHEEINLDGLDAENTEPQLAHVDLSKTNHASSSLYIPPGTIVSVVGFYNGSIITAVECIPLSEQVLLGKYIDTLAAVGTLKQL